MAKQKKKKKKKEESLLTKTEMKYVKKHEDKRYRAFIILSIIGVIYYFFIEPTTIGGDWRYGVFVFAVPTLLGVIAWGIYSREYIRLVTIDYKGFGAKAALACFLLVEGLFLSYLSFGSAANITWNTINQIEADNNGISTQEYDITELTKGRRRRRYINFKFDENNEERLRINSSTYRTYIDENISKYKLNIRQKEGIWGYYIVDSYSIVSK